MGPADSLAHYGVPAQTGARRKKYIDQVVDLFLNGCRARAVTKTAALARRR
jgi:hypothetical protein